MSMTPTIPGNATSKNTPVLLFGDRPFSAQVDCPGLELPSRDRMRKLLEIYFDFSIVTYRFLHRGTVESLVKTVYDKNISPSNPPPSHWAGKAGVVFMVLAVSILCEERNNGNDEIHPENERSASLNLRIWNPLN
jgi:hypothetical protein